MKACLKKYTLQFKLPAGTSRGTYKTRDSWFLFLEEEGITGIGECAPFSGLSMETSLCTETIAINTMSSKRWRLVLSIWGSFISEKYNKKLFSRIIAIYQIIR